MHWQIIFKCSVIVGRSCSCGCSPIECKYHHTDNRRPARFTALSCCAVRLRFSPLRLPVDRTFFRPSFSSEQPSLIVCSPSWVQSFGVTSTSVVLLYSCRLSSNRVHWFVLVITLWPLSGRVTQHTAHTQTDNYWRPQRLICRRNLHTFFLNISTRYCLLNLLLIASIDDHGGDTCCRWQLLLSKVFCLLFSSVQWRLPTGANF